MPEYVVPLWKVQHRGRDQSMATYKSTATSILRSGSAVTLGLGLALVLALVLALGESLI